MNKIIALSHTKGGVGKSTDAYHLAYALASLGEKVTILDLDFQKTLFFINGIREATNKVEENPVEVIVVEDIDTLTEICENNKEVLIIDVGGFDNDINRLAMTYSDMIIVPISPSITEVIGFHTFEAILEETGLENVKVLLNNIHPNTKNFTEIEKAVSNMECVELLKSVIYRRKSYESSMRKGLSVLEESDKKAIKEIEALALEIRGAFDE